MQNEKSVLTKKHTKFLSSPRVKHIAEQNSVLCFAALWSANHILHGLMSPVRASLLDLAVGLKGHAARSASHSSILSSDTWTHGWNQFYVGMIKWENTIVPKGCSVKAQQLFSIVFYQHESVLPIGFFFRYLRHIGKIQNLLVLLSQKSFKEFILINQTGFASSKTYLHRSCCTFQSDLPDAPAINLHVNSNRKSF